MLAMNNFGDVCLLQAGMLWGSVSFLCLDVCQLGACLQKERGAMWRKRLAGSFFCICICIAKAAEALAWFMGLHLTILDEQMVSLFPRNCMICDRLNGLAG